MREATIEAALLWLLLACVFAVTAANAAPSSAVLSGKGTFEPPLLLRLLHRFPMLRRLPARLLGLGFRPEHIRTPERVTKAT